MSVYEKYPGINFLDVNRRIEAFRSTALDFLNSGESTVEKLQDVIVAFEEDEQYEAAQGILMAIEDFAVIQQD